MNITNAQEIGCKIGDIINGQEFDDVKLALQAIWDLVHEIEKENV